MKKLMMAAVLAGTMVAVAAENEVKPAEAVPPPPAELTAEKPHRPSPEQVAARRARREKMMAEMAARQAELDKKIVEIVKKYGLDDAKANALLKELKDASLTKQVSRPRPPMRPAGRPAVKPAVKPDAKPDAATTATKAQ